MSLVRSNASTIFKLLRFLLAGHLDLLRGSFDRDQMRSLLLKIVVSRKFNDWLSEKTKTLKPVVDVEPSPEKKIKQFNSYSLARKIAFSHNI